MLDGLVHERPEAGAEVRLFLAAEQTSLLSSIPRVSFRGHPSPAGEGGWMFCYGALKARGSKRGSPLRRGGGGDHRGPSCAATVPSAW
jgi:hypothetical protein